MPDLSPISNAVVTPLAPPTGRLAPSPTGALHLGNARTFLCTWLSIRSQGGRLLLRMEDLDHPKVKPGTARQALDDLHWLGLEWDEGPEIGGPHGPYVQSERIPHYEAALTSLRQQGLVYPCTCSRQDVEAAQSAPHASDYGPRYPGTCRHRYASYSEACAALPPGRLPAWRFAAGTAEADFHDGFHGAQVATPDACDGDFVLARHAKGAGYMLAVVVDDASMGVTEVMRGDDLLPATHRQILIQRALGLPQPRYIHLPLVTHSDGRRLAKRHGDTRLATLRADGISPERVLGVLAMWCGWAAAGEALSPAELLQRYDPSAIPKTAVVLDDAVKRQLSIRAAT
jgi:glutamyl-tRNA synthetase